MGIIDDHQVLVQPQLDIREYGFVTDNQLATSFLFKEQDLWIYHNEHFRSEF